MNTAWLVLCLTIHALSSAYRKASEQAYNSTTHPTEWHFLNRLVKSKKGTLDQIHEAWEAGEHLLAVWGHVFNFKCVLGFACA